MEVAHNVLEQQKNVSQAVPMNYIRRQPDCIKNEETRTRKFTKEPGCEGKRLILLRLMSKISSDGITVSYNICELNGSGGSDDTTLRTTSGKTVKLLFFKTRYRR